MLSFKEYLKLQEALNDAQKRTLGIYHNDQPRAAAKEISKNVIPNGGGGSIHIPLTADTQGDIKQHLEKRGFEISNYAKGTAKDKHGREVSIGSVLKSPKTAAPEHMTKGFDNDDRSSTYTKDTHHILYSNIPAIVGSAASGGKIKSCRSLTPSGRFTTYGGGAAAAKKIPDEIEAASHIAFLMPNGKTDTKHAEARIMVNRYNTYNKNGEIEHSVLAPEKKVYSVSGGTHSSFHSSLDKFIREKYPMKEGRVYNQDPAVYDDGQKVVFNTSPKSVKQILLGKEARYQDKEEAIKSVKLPANTITSVLNEPQTDENRQNLRYAHGLIAKHQKLSDSHFDHLLANGHIEPLSENKSLSKGQVKKIAAYSHTPVSSGDTEFDNVVNKSGDDSVTKAHVNIIRKHPDKLGSDDIHSILDTNANHEEELKKGGVKVDHAGPISALATNMNFNLSKLTPEHIAKIKKSINPTSTYLTGESDDDFDDRTILGITPEDSKKDIQGKLSKILDQPDSVLTRHEKLVALNHKDLTTEHISKALNSANPSIAHAAIRNKKASPENISKALKHSEVSVNLEAAKHENNNEDTINEGLNRGEVVARESMENDNATSGNIINGLKHSSPRVNIAAAEHQNNDENSINAALNPKNIDVVKYTAAKHYNVTPKNISKALDDKDPNLGVYAMKNGDASSENISKGLNHEDSGVRLAALTHNNATPEHYKMATNDPETSIRVKARNLLSQA